tara:strand:+ start:828 stop:1190 length:363 start_codon:yes stop_codon:yes gene_type:complete
MKRHDPTLAQLCKWPFRTSTLPAMTLGCAVLMLATAAQATPAQTCAPREVVVKRLASGYGETRQSIGLGTNNSMVEIFASDESGSWTITVTSPQGITCLIASGQAFETLAEALPIDDQDA